MRAARIAGVMLAAALVGAGLTPVEAGNPPYAHITVQSDLYPSQTISGAVRRGQPVKVLGTGDLGGVKVDIQAHAFSASAAEKIGAAGGSTTRI